METRPQALTDSLTQQLGGIREHQLMTTKPEHPLSCATELVFLYTYHNLPGLSDGESVEYFIPTAFQRFRDQLKSHIDRQLELFSNCYDYADYFSSADYGNPEDSISEDEELEFRSVLSRQVPDTPLKDLDSCDVLAGLRAVILYRVTSGDLAGVRSAVDLFNWIMEGAIEAVDSSNPCSYIRIESAAEFAPWFIKSVLESIEGRGLTRRRSAYVKFVGERFRPLAPVLKMLHSTVQEKGWPWNDLSLGEFLLIVDYFNRVIEDEWRS